MRIMLIECRTPEEVARVPRGDVSRLEPEAFVQTQPRVHLALVGTEGRLVARASTWFARDREGEVTDTGLVGHFAATDERSALEILAAAEADLHPEGCRQILGPMDGSTWNSYRLITDRGDEPPFFLEMEHPPDWPEYFLSAGFVPFAHYFSALARTLEVRDPKTPDRLKALATRGIRIRTIDMDRFESELRGLYSLSCKAFAGNLLYSPIPWDDFFSIYRKIEPRVVPDVVLVAEDERSHTIGYAFAIPDLLEAAREGRARTLLIKTVAVDPDLGGLGLGSVLVDLCQKAGADLGLTRAIHVYMHETNRSRAISEKFGTPIRRYTLFARELEHGRGDGR